MPNPSKVKDPRFWAKWRESGAVRRNPSPVKFNQQSHPEIRSGEVFLTNADEDLFRQLGWMSKRRGHIAFDVKGNPISDSWPDSFPVFVKKKELEKAGVFLS